MKNLKLFVFALCAVLLSVVTVNAATCNLPGETGQSSDCQAIVNGVGYDTIDHAWTQVEANGGTLEVIGTNTITFNAAHTITKNITIKGLAANKVNLSASGVFTIANNGSLTFENVVLDVKHTITVNKGGNLVFNNVAVTSDQILVTNNGTTTVNGGTIKVTNHSAFENVGTLTLNNVTRVDASVALVLVKNGSSTIVDGGKYVVKNLFTAPSANPVKQPLSSDLPDEVAAKFVVRSGNVVATDGSTVDHEMNVTFENATYNVSSGKALTLTKGTLTVNGGSITAQNGDAIDVNGTTDEAKLTVTGGTVESTTGGYALALKNTKATYVVSGGIFNSKGAKGRTAIYLNGGMVSKVDGKVVVTEALRGILTGGKYLNNIIAKVDVDGGTYDVSNQLVAEGYTVKTEDSYKVVVSTKAAEETNKPGAKPGEEAPNTFDAGLVYMGLALSAIGASVVSVRKLRNN